MNFAGRVVLVVLASLAAIAAEADELDRRLEKEVPVVERFHEFGHACPVSHGLITAWHVARSRQEPTLAAVVDGRHELAANTARRHRALDAALWPLPEGMAPLPIATTPVKKGDRVRIVGFGDALEPRVFSTEVQYVVGAQFTTRDGAGPGSSGSCVVNEAGEVVGVNIGGKAKAVGSGFYGMSVGIDRFQEDQFRPLDDAEGGPEEEEGGLLPEAHFVRTLVYNRR